MRLFVGFLFVIVCCVAVTKIRDSRVGGSKTTIVHFRWPLENIGVYPEAGKFTDENFTTGATDDLLFYYQKSGDPKDDGEGILQRVCENLSEGAWLSAFREEETISTGTEELGVRIEEGYEYIEFRFKRYDKPEYERLGEHLIQEVIDIRLRVSHDRFSWIEIEMVRR